MSEVYCRTCEDDIYNDDEEFVPIPKDRLDSPAILTNISQRNKRIVDKIQAHSILNGTADFEISTAMNAAINLHASVNACKNTAEANKKTFEDYEFGDDIVTNNDSLAKWGNEPKIIVHKTLDEKDVIRVRGKEELPVPTDQQIEDNLQHNYSNKSILTSKDGVSNDNQWQKSIPSNSKDLSSESEPICSRKKANSVNIISNSLSKKIVCTNDHPLLSNKSQDIDTRTNTQNKSQDNEKATIYKQMHHMYSTLPRIKKVTAIPSSGDVVNRPPFSIPTRITSDGTTIHYLCDLPKNILKGVPSFVITNIFLTKVN